MFTTILVQPLANGLILFYNLLGSNLGLAITVFSIFLITIMRPLTRPYMESMKKIKEVAPQLEKLKKKHGKDKMKMAQAQAELYKQHKINPGAGCLPYLLQIVILIAFFNLFTRTLTKGGDITANFNDLLYPALKFAEGYTVNTNFLWLDLSKPDVFHIPGLPFAIPGVLLIASAAAQFFSAKAMSSMNQVAVTQAEKTKGETDDIAASMQKSMIYTFPLISLIVGLNFPSGLALYWLTFSLLQVYQQKNGNSLVPSFLQKEKMIESGK